MDEKLEISVSDRLGSGRSLSLMIWGSLRLCGLEPL